MTRPGFSGIWSGPEAEGRLAGIYTLFLGPEAAIEDVVALSVDYSHVFANPEFIEQHGVDSVLEMFARFPPKTVLTLCAPLPLIEEIGNKLEGSDPRIELMLTISTEAPISQIRVLSGESIKVAERFVEARHEFYTKDEVITKAPASVFDGGGEQ